MIWDLESTFSVGEDTFFESDSPTSSFAVVFEDDLTTGYFYAMDRNAEKRILDALHIYNVADVVDRDKPCIIQIVWTESGNLASLLINNYCHAIFDFKNSRGYSRSAFPPANGPWKNPGADRKLTDDLIQDLFKYE